MIHLGQYQLGVLKYKAACSVNLECLSVADLMAVFECDWACRCGDFSGGICVIDAHFAGTNEDCGNQQFVTQLVIVVLEEYVMTSWSVLPLAMAGRLLSV